MGCARMEAPPRNGRPSEPSTAPLEHARRPGIPCRISARQQAALRLVRQRLTGIAHLHRPDAEARHIQMAEVTGCAV